MAKDILDAVYGCLIGGAIGDALGAPVEGWYWTEIREKVGRVRELMPGFGNTGAHYPNRVWVNERALLWKLKAGMNPWQSGRGMIPAGCATMAIAPVGIINAGNPAQAYQDGFNIAFVDQEGHNRDGAATMAAGVAAAFLPDATVESVLETMAGHASYLMRRAIELTMDLAYTSDTIDEFAERYYAKMLDWSWPTPPGRAWNKEHFFSGNTIELVPITMAILYLCAGDVNESMIEAASFGRDCDTTASMAGSIAGAMHGASAIRQDWIATVEGANEDFFEEVEGDPKANFHAMAQRLVDALRSERQATRDRLAMLKRILA
jgi:ADP-ribosylglycohydrolase